MTATVVITTGLGGSATAQVGADARMVRPSPVRSLHVVRQRNHQVTVAWSRPTRGTIRSYRVTYPGGVLKLRSTARSAVLGGLVNGSVTMVRVQAVNRAGASRATTVRAVAAGRPASPGAPSLTLVNGQGGTLGVHVSWIPVGPNGPGPVTYQVLRDSDVVCAWRAATACDDILPTDGSSHRYRVLARNAEETAGREPSAGLHTSSPSATSTVVASAVPDLVTVTTFVATGANGQVSVGFTTGKSHGAQHVVECRLNGATCTGSPWTLAGDGVSATKTFASGVANGSTAAVQLRLCNGSAGPQSCSGWSGASTTPYGPIGVPSLGTNVSGPSVGVVATWNANGKSVNVEISRGGTTLWSASGVGSGSHSFSDAVGYGVSATYQITVTDTGLAPGQQASRAPQTAQASANTPPAPPKVTVSKGASAVGKPGCTDPSCSFVVATTSGFPGAVTCQISQAYGGTAGFITWAQGGNETKQSPDYYGYSNGWVDVSCNGVAAPRFYW